MKCPACKESLLVIAERKGIEIDYCPDCRGIWLDRGELDKILEKSKSENDLFLQNNFKNRSQSEYDQKPYKRRKSLLEELFD
jgi:Zn-finger nucleic acid-binding protein